MIKKFIKEVMISLVPNGYLEIRSRRAGDFEKEVNFLDILCDKSKSSIDIGASLGTYSYLMLKHSKNVVAIEPLNEKCIAFDRLFRNIQRIKIINCALSNQIGKTKIRVPVDDLGRSTLEKSNRLSDISVKIEDMIVDVRTLDSLNLRNIGFIKIDVEGHEESVISGGLEILEKEKPNLLIEIEERHKSGSINSVVTLLKGINYNCFFYLDGKLRFFKEFDLYKHQIYGKEPYINNFIFTVSGGDLDNRLKR